MSAGAGSPPGGAPRAALVVATRNRVDELRGLLRSAAAQTVPVEMLVMDDGASDEVARMVAVDFPGARYFRLGTGMGPAFQRNRGIELAAALIAFPLDDDALLVSPRTVEQTLAEFDDPVVGAVAIPFVNVRYDARVRQRAPAGGGPWIGHAFVGAAHALRRDVVLALGGFREHFFYMGEEGDLGLRMLAAGYVIRMGSADAIHHLESPRRNLAMADYCGRRNDVLFAWHNVPGAMLPVHLAATTVNGMRAAVGAQNPGSMLMGLLHGYVACFRHRREPVPAAIYRLHRRLKKSGPLALAEVRAELPAPSLAGAARGPAPR